LLVGKKIEAKRFRSYYPEELFFFWQRFEIGKPLALNTRVLVSRSKVFGLSWGSDAVSFMVAKSTLSIFQI
jgi:hypothetical protein